VKALVMFVISVIGAFFLNEFYRFYHTRVNVVAGAITALIGGLFGRRADQLPGPKARRYPPRIRGQIFALLDVRHVASSSALELGCVAISIIKPTT
jgi:hypothetical protein